jgi:hypothetical protein
VSFFLKQPNGLLAYFGTVIDDFIAVDMTVLEAEVYAQRELDLGPKAAAMKVSYGVEDRDVRLGRVLPGGNGLQRFAFALRCIELAHGVAGREQRERELSVPRPPIPNPEKTP